MKRTIRMSLWIIFLLHTPLLAEDGVSWKRESPTAPEPQTIFISNHAVNYETVSTNYKGNLEFQIYHRFFPALSEGYEELYGFDGPVNMRLGFGYSLTDNFMITLGRSNVDNNLDLRAKYRFLRHADESFPLALAVQGGVAWNSDIFGRDNTDARNFQYYGQIIFNLGIMEKAAVGIVPSYLYNSDIGSEEYLDNVSLGMYIQYYMTNRISTLFEYGTVIDGYSREYDVFALGNELQTAGHIFKLFITNGLLLNPSQYLTGSDFALDSDEWRFGFMVTRLIPIG